MSSDSDNEQGSGTRASWRACAQLLLPTLCQRSAIPVHCKRFSSGLAACRRRSTRPFSRRGETWGERRLTNDSNIAELASPHAQSLMRDTGVVLVNTGVVAPHPTLPLVATAITITSRKPEAGTLFRLWWFSWDSAWAPRRRTPGGLEGSLGRELKGVGFRELRRASSAAFYAPKLRIRYFLLCSRQFLCGVRLARDQGERVLRWLLVAENPSVI